MSVATDVRCVNVRGGCFACGETSIRTDEDGRLVEHEDKGAPCGGGGIYADPHDTPEARATKTCGYCGSTNYDCGDHGCCAPCRFARRTMTVKEKETVR